MKVKIRNGTKSFILGFIIIISMFMLLNNHSNAATTGTANVMFYLNGSSVPGYTEGGLKQGTSGTSISIPAPPNKTGYTFKGWLQQGNSGIGPWGKPVWFDGEFVSRAATDICAKYFYPVATYVTKVTRPADCQTKVSPNVVRLTITEDGKYSGADDYISLIWSSEMNVSANSNIKCMMYAKIPPGYALSPATSGATNPGTLLLSGTDYYKGTGEFQYYESTWFNGNGPQGYGMFAIKKTDKSLPDPTPANPLVIDIAYYNYTKCDGSAGTSLGNGTGSYKFDYTSPTVWVQDCLTAIFDPNIYNITYDANGGIGVPAIQSYGYSSSKTLALTGTVPIKSGYTFLGWSENKNATTAQYQPRYAWSCGTMASTTLYAIWKLSEMPKIQSPKTLILDNNGIGEFIILGTISYGSIDIVLPATVYFYSPNKTPVPGNIILSTKCLNKDQNIALGSITAPSITAGSWITSFNIHYILKNN